MVTSLIQNAGSNREKLPTGMVTSFQIKSKEVTTKTGNFHQF